MSLFPSPQHTNKERNKKQQHQQLTHVATMYCL